MSTESEKYRNEMKSKARRLASADPHQKVDSSDFSPTEALDADVQTGMRPISRRAFKKGGKVLGKAEGHKSKARADRAPRAAGGKTLTPNTLINRNEKEANEERHGKKHVGGFARGGKTSKCDPNAGCDPYSENDGGGSVTEDRKRGGRTARASGGRTKGKTNINIIIGSGKPQQPPMLPNAPVRPPIAAQPPAVMPAPAPAGGAPMPMPRKSGGRIARLSGGLLKNYEEKADKEHLSALNTYNRWPSESEAEKADKLATKRKVGTEMARKKLSGEAKVNAKDWDNNSVRYINHLKAKQKNSDDAEKDVIASQYGNGSGKKYKSLPEPHAKGGRTIHVTDHAAGGGKGRLEKIKAYGLKP